MSRTCRAGAGRKCSCLEPSQARANPSCKATAKTAADTWGACRCPLMLHFSAAPGDEPQNDATRHAEQEASRARARVSLHERDEASPIQAQPPPPTPPARAVPDLAEIRIACFACLSACNVSLPRHTFCSAFLSVCKRMKYHRKINQAIARKLSHSKQGYVARSNEDSDSGCFTLASSVCVNVI